jgi:hypothetical protein
MDQETQDAAAIEARIGHIRALGIEAPRKRWRLISGATPPKGPTKVLIARMIAYRIQRDAFGGLDRETDRLLERLARGGKPPGLSRRLKAGTVLVREYQGERHTVTVVPGGFLWQEGVYPSLSVIARAITGTAWNGPRFFGLRVPSNSETGAATVAKPSPPQAMESSMRGRSSAQPSGAAGSHQGSHHG